MKKLERTLDPVTFEVFRGSFEYIPSKMRKIMERVSFSPLIYEMLDFSVAIYNEKAELIGQTAGCPIHLGSMHFSTQAAIEKFGKDGLNEGDVVILNDPYAGGTHIPDVTCVNPIHYEGELIGYGCSRAHWTDIGGGGSGGQAFGTHVATEGFRMFPMKLIEGGEWNKELVDLIKNQTRMPQYVEGDLMSQVGALRVAEDEMRLLVKRYGWNTVKTAMVELIAYTESIFRQAFDEIPDGEYEAEEFAETDGFTEESIPLKAALRVKGDTLTVDFTDTAPQAMGAINSPYANTVGAVYYAIASWLAPRVPMNWGAFKCIDIVLPDNCWINAKWPAPTIACTTFTACKISSAIWQALAKAVPEKAVASTYSENNWFVATVRDPETDMPIVISDLPTGGWGGTPTHDGIDNSSDPLGQCQSLEAEIAEMAHPVHWDRFEMRTDSGGAGKYRGGLGMILKFTPLGHMELSQESSRMKIGVWGVNGGGRSLVQYALRKEKDGTTVTISGLDEKGKYHKSLTSNAPFPPGSSFIFAATGGGGWGDPLERDPEKVLEDVLDEYVSIEGARKDYGVVIDKKTTEISHAATKELRKNLRTSEEYRRDLQGIRKDYVQIQ